MKTGMVSLNDICTELNEDCDSAIADDFAKGAKRLADEQGMIDLSNAEFQLYIRDFLELHESDYQLDIFKPILLQYYDNDYDLIEESANLSEERLVEDEDVDVDYNDSYGAIIDEMETAVSYEELYEIADKIVDPALCQEVKDAIKVCEDDGEEVDVAYSMVTSDRLDMRRYEKNESKEIKEEKKTKLSAEELAAEYFGIAHDTYDLEWNSADAKERKKLVKKAVSEFVAKYPEVKDVIKEFAAILENENYHSDREEFNKLYKFESAKVTEAESKDRFEASINGFTENLKSQDELDCFNAIIRTLNGLTDRISTFGISLIDQTQNFVILTTEENGETFVMEFDTELFGKPVNLYVVNCNAIVNKDFLETSNLLYEILKKGI